MSKPHYTCAVAGCTAANMSMHTLPRDKALRQEWVNFIFSNKVPDNVSQHLRLCSAHFSPDCIENQARYNAGFALKLVLTPGAVPTVLNPASDIQQVSQKLPTFPCEVGCQTEAPQNGRRTVGTQLGRHTLLHVRSRATQVTTASIGVGSDAISTPAIALPILTSTPADSPPSKQARVDFDDSVEVPDDDTSYNPGDSDVTDSTITSQSPPSIHETPKYIVYEDCLMQLFDTCPVCCKRCQVQKVVRGTFLSVDQRCPHCSYTRKWNSQPICGSTPAGNLQLSAAILFSGSSFLQTKKVETTFGQIQQPETSDIACQVDLPSSDVSFNVNETSPVNTERPTLQHIIDEEAIIQLLESCPKCNRKCRSTKRSRSPYMIVYQNCYFCEYRRKWASQPEALNINISQCKPRKQKPPRLDRVPLKAETQESHLENTDIATSAGSDLPVTNHQ